MGNQRSVLVIGAGPAGITCAYELAKNNLPSTLIEKEDVAGGICRTTQYKGFKFDVGGHRFFTKSKIVEQIWRQALAEDFLARNRYSHIYFNEKFFSYPIKIFDVVGKVGLFESLLIFKDYVKAQVLYRNKPEVSFCDWITKRFGDKLFNMFFKTYTEKIWGISCSQLSSEWATQRIKGLSMGSVVKNALFGNIGKIKTLIEEFHYPKYGVGQMYDKILSQALEKGAEIEYKTEPVEIEVEGNRVVSVSVKDAAGNVNKQTPDYLVSSMPFSRIFDLFKPAVPQYLKEAAEKLRYRCLIEVCFIIKGKCDCKDQWIYIHDPKLRTGRLQIYKNWSPYMGSGDESVINMGMEYFCFKEDDLWQMTDSQIMELAKTELARIGVLKEFQVIDGFVIKVPYAYPVYVGAYKEYIGVLKDYIEKIENLQVIGRCGLHKYNNMDHSMLTGIYAAHNIMEGQKKYDVWDVNVEQEYLEEKERVKEYKVGV
jgi:protoporphyrinogen oxidase